MHFLTQDSFVRAKKWVREVQRQGNCQEVNILRANLRNIELNINHMMLKLSVILGINHDHAICW